MLVSLHIQNFALIDQVELQLNKGFTVLTGETGSGKSILLAALNLILGERADYTVIGPSGDKSIVEAYFQLNSSKYQSFFELNDLDWSDDLICIRREITKQGKSRAFINDSPVQLVNLKELTEQLIHIHSQHHTLELKKKSFQIEVLDSLADLNQTKQNYLGLYTNWLSLKRKIEELELQLTKSVQQADYNRFQYDEIYELDLANRNYKALEAELESVESVDDIKQALEHIHFVLDGEESVIQQLNKLKTSLDRLRNKDQRLNEFFERIQVTTIDLKDISSEAADYLDSIEVNPFRVNELTQLLDQFNKVLKKHGLTDQEALIHYFDSLALALDENSHLEEQINDLRNQQALLYSELIGLAEEMHQKRITQKDEIAQQLVNQLIELKMPNSVVEFEVIKKEELSATGFSEVSLKFSPNKGIAPVSIDKAASGGELSRFMLVIQQLTSLKQALPTLIFDEIDTGVSGEVAQKIGQMLNKMGESIQLLAISHLPQVAGKAQSHFKVYKEQEGERTQTSVVALDQTERIQEIARLLSGEEINQAAIENAKILMS